MLNLKTFLICGGIAVLAGCRQGTDERIERAHLLARNPSSRNRDRIEALVHDADRDVRTTALVLMETIDRDRARRIAEGALHDDDGFVRAAAVAILGPGADEATARMLAALATDDPVWQVRARVLESVAPGDDPAVAEAFVGALSDPVRHVRRAALEAGVAHPGLLPVDRLTDLVVSDPDWEARVDAARALGASGDRAAYQGLDAAVADPNEFVRAAAVWERRALEQAGIGR